MPSGGSEKQSVLPDVGGSIPEQSVLLPGGKGDKPNSNQQSVLYEGKVDWEQTVLLPKKYLEGFKNENEITRENLIEVKGRDPNLGGLLHDAWLGEFQDVGRQKTLKIDDRRITRSQSAEEMMTKWWRKRTIDGVLEDVLAKV